VAEPFGRLGQGQADLAEPLGRVHASQHILGGC
jgi:hypothetical protein